QDLDVPAPGRQAVAHLPEDRLGAAHHVGPVARGDEAQAAFAFHASTMSTVVFMWRTPGSPVGLNTLNEIWRSSQWYWMSSSRECTATVMKYWPSTIGTRPNPKRSRRLVSTFPSSKLRRLVLVPYTSVSTWL